MATNKTDKLIHALQTKGVVEVADAEIQVGKSYPIYGSITKIFHVSREGVLVELNHRLHLQFNLADKESVERIKAHAFEPGIFVTTITEVGSQFKGECTQAIFSTLHNNEV